MSGDDETSAFRFGLSGGKRTPGGTEPDAPPPSVLSGGLTARRGGGPPKLLVILLALVVVAGVAYTAVGFLSGDGEEPVASTDVAPTTSIGTTPPDVAKPRELDAETAEDQIGQGHVALKVTRNQQLRTRPDADGQLVARIGRKTPYGGQVILPIVKARGDWVAVVSPYRKNNRVAWTKVQPNAKFVAVEYSVAIRVRSRSIIVRKNGKVIRRMKAAVGQVTHPTPPGRYAVTDGLIFTAATRGTYGCCALVLSARQTKLPDNWTGGDRIAIHGTPNKDSIGLAASLGCLRVGDAPSRWLVKNVPAGTTVFVRS
ncbi:MAG: L,D-transpeptidase [Solirubrobacteraceae bacterium]|nr:L,D-transpeptidase [Solirubrobacteraceae bacterium]